MACLLVQLQQSLFVEGIWDEWPVQGHNAYDIIPRCP